jgi:SprT protein
VTQLSRYMPEDACRLGYQWLKDYPAKLLITKKRKTKLGDFRIRDKNSKPQISVNGDLNPFSFVITFTHEIAHLMDFTKRNTLRNPHGDSWKNIYSTLLMELCKVNVFPDELKPAVARHIRSPKAASCSDVELLQTLRQFDNDPKLTLNQLSPGAQFSLNQNRLFEKGELRRTRYRCMELSSGKFFLVHGASEVQEIPS